MLVLQVPWFWALHELGTSASLAMGSLFAAATADRWPHWTPATAAITLIICLVLSAISAAATTTALGTGSSDAVPPAAVAVVAAALAATISMAEVHLAVVCAACGTVLLSSTIYYYADLSSVGAVPAGCGGGNSWGLYPAGGVLPASAIVLHIGLADGVALLCLATAAAISCRRAQSAALSSLATSARSSAAARAAIAAASANCHDGMSLDGPGRLLTVLAEVRKTLPQSATPVHLLPARAYAGQGPILSEEEEQSLLAQGSCEVPSCNGGTPILSAGLMAEVQCLEQLLVQASCIAELLRRKVMEWALVSDGHFPVTVYPATSDRPVDCKLNGHSCACDGMHRSCADCCGFVAWRSAVRDPAIAARVLWPSCPPLARVLSAIGRAQSQHQCLHRHPTNFSWYIDPKSGVGPVAAAVGVCRFAVYHRALGGITALLEAARRDPEVRILACRDQVGQSLDARDVTGQRDVEPAATAFSWKSLWDYGEGEDIGKLTVWMVSLLVRLETAEARRLGLERHVCEVVALLIVDAPVVEEGAVRPVK